jgi:hypothetical protein
VDLNHLFARHQTALMQAVAAGSREASLAHRARAACYADKIRHLQRDLGAHAAPLA